jgi:hypothetical protein
MIKRNGPNERVKRRYLQYLKEVKGRDEASLDAVANTSGMPHREIAASCKSLKPSRSHSRKRTP